MAAAIVLGIISVVIINRYIKAKTSAPEIKTIRVIIAAEPIQASQTISINQLGTREIPENAVSEVNIVVPSTADPARAYEAINRLKVMIAGRQAARNISLDSPLFWTDLKEAEAQSLSDLISKNRRAVTIPVDQLSSLGYNITAGDRVDIISTKENSCGGAENVNVSVSNPAGSVRDLLDVNQIPAGTQESENKSFLLMQDVLVLAVGQDYNTFSGRSDRQGASFSSVTLEASLEEALMLTHARSNATLSLVLRNPGSTERFQLDKIPVVDCSNIKAVLAPKLDKIRASEKNISQQNDDTTKPDDGQTSED